MDNDASDVGEVSLNVGLPVGFAKVKEVIMLTVGAAFKIFDTYSDMALAYILATGMYEPDCSVGIDYENYGNKCALRHSQPVLAIATVIPTCFCCLFTASYWWKVESGFRQKTLTLPLVISQLYLPFSELRFVYQLLKSDNHMVKNKRWYDANMSTIGESDVFPPDVLTEVEPVFNNFFSYYKIIL